MAGGPSRLALAHLPTPLEPAPRFSAQMKTCQIWIKRDDCTGLAFGGNKPRKLEYLMASARESGADTVITFGAVQSNHTRSTAAAARRLGMGCHLILAGAPPDETNGNLLLDRLMGASLDFLSLLPAELTPDKVEESYAMAEERLKKKGRRPFRIGPGGSTALGVLGYCAAFDELMSQARETGVALTHVLTAVGTGGTFAGLTLGNILAGRPVSIVGISVAPPGMPAALGVPPIEQLVAQAGALLGREVALRDDDLRVSHDYAGRGYAAPTHEAIEAIRALALTEALFLEPVYTGKAMAGLIGLCRKNELRESDKVAFIHTGGSPALFVYNKVLAP